MLQKFAAIFLTIYFLCTDYRYVSKTIFLVIARTVVLHSFALCIIQKGEACKPPPGDATKCVRQHLTYCMSCMYMHEGVPIRYSVRVTYPVNTVFSLGKRREDPIKIPQVLSARTVPISCRRSRWCIAGRGIALQWTTTFLYVSCFRSRFANATLYNVTLHNVMLDVKHLCHLARQRNIGPSEIG